MRKNRTAGQLLAGLALAFAMLLPASALGAHTCGIALVSVAFGSYSPFSGSPLLTTGTLTVTCTLTSGGPETANLTAKLDAGLHAVGGSYSQRRMQNAEANDFLAYRITKTLDGGCVGTNVWGDLAGDVQTASLDLTVLDAPVEKVWTIFGCSPASQDVKSSTSYTDSVTVTVDY